MQRPQLPQHFPLTIYGSPGWKCCVAYLHVYLHSKPGFSLEIYLQMMHNTIGRYESPSLHTAIEMLSGKPG